MNTIATQGGTLPIIGRGIASLGLALAISTAAVAEPVTLKVSFWSSDRSPAYQSLVKPFVDAINREGGDLLRAQVYFSGALSPVQSLQPKLVLDGVADLAFIVPGQNPELFKDNGAIELPGLFKDTREASLVYTRLVAKNAFRGYDDFFPIATVGTYPDAIHSRKPVASLADIKGQRLRVNNPIAAVAVRKLGGIPAVVALNETADAISGGTVDGVLVQPAQLFDVGLQRLVTHHYLVHTASAPLALLMNRKVFVGLPSAAQNLIRKYSGEWAAEQYIEVTEANNERTLAQLRADPRRKVTVPSVEDRAAAQRAFDTVVEEWTAKSDRNRQMLAMVKAELSKLRESK